LRLELRDEADLDRLDVVRARVDREMLGQIRVMVGVALDVFLDVDPRVRRLEPLVEIVVSEVAEQADPQGDGVTTASRSRAREVSADGNACQHDKRCH
jgi:hypothetical protein